MIFAAVSLAWASPAPRLPVIDFSSDQAPQLYVAAPPIPEDQRPPEVRPPPALYTLRLPPLVPRASPLGWLGTPVLDSVRGSYDLRPEAYSIFPNVGPADVQPLR
jgi:hypothetical protein